HPDALCGKIVHCAVCAVFLTGAGSASAGVCVSLCGLSAAPPPHARAADPRRRRCHARCGTCRVAGQGVEPRESEEREEVTDHTPANLSSSRSPQVRVMRSLWWMGLFVFVGPLSIDLVARFVLAWADLWMLTA